MFILLFHNKNSAQQGKNNNSYIQFSSDFFYEHNVTVATELKFCQTYKISLAWDPLPNSAKASCLLL